MNIREDTINNVFKKFNQLNDFDYCIARNHQDLPKVHSDLDILYDGNLKSAENELKIIAESDWDLLIKFEGNVKGFNKYRCFYIYWFVKFEKKKIILLQIDLSNSFLIYGIPYYTFSKKKDYVIYKNLFKILEDKISTSHQLFQIDKLIKLNLKISNSEKLLKYKNNILSTNSHNFFSFIPTKKFKYLLISDSLFNYKILIALTKMKFLLSIFIRKPIYSTCMLLTRFSENRIVKKNINYFQLNKMKEKSLDIQEINLINQIKEVSIILFSKHL